MAGFASDEQIVGTEPVAQCTNACEASHWVRGTDVELMVVREINSRTAHAGDRFNLRLNAPLLIDGKVAVPVGASAVGEVLATSGTSAAGGRGTLSVRLLYLETPRGHLAIESTVGTEGKSNTGGVVLSVLGFGLLGLLNKGGNASLKAGDIIHARIAEGGSPTLTPLVVTN